MSASAGTIESQPAAEGARPIKSAGVANKTKAENMDPFYSQQQQQPPQQQPQYPQQQHGSGHFPNNNASHNYFMHQPHFLQQQQNPQQQNTNLGGNVDQQQEQAANSSFSDGSFQGNQPTYRSLYQAQQPGTASSSHSQDNQ